MDYYPGRFAINCTFSAPQPVVRPFVIPFWRGLKITRCSGVKTFLNFLFIEFYTQSGRIERDIGITFCNHGLTAGHLHEVFPPWDIHGMMLQRQEILCGGSTVNICHEAHRSACHVHCHCNAGLFGIIAYLFCFKQSSGCSKIGVDYIHCLCIDQRFETVIQAVYIFTCAGGSFKGIRNSFPLFSICLLYTSRCV